MHDFVMEHLTVTYGLEELVVSHAKVLKTNTCNKSSHNTTGAQSSSSQVQAPEGIFLGCSHALGVEAVLCRQAQLLRRFCGYQDPSTTRSDSLSKRPVHTHAVPLRPAREDKHRRRHHLKFGQASTFLSSCSADNPG